MRILTRLTEGMKPSDRQRSGAAAAAGCAVNRYRRGSAGCSHRTAILPPPTAAQRSAGYRMGNSETLSQSWRNNVAHVQRGSASRRGMRGNGKKAAQLQKSCRTFFENPSVDSCRSVSERRLTDSGVRVPKSVGFLKFAVKDGEI